MSCDLIFLPVYDADNYVKNAIAKVVFSLDSSFYSLLFNGESQAINNIVNSLNAVSGDLGCGSVAYLNNEPIGYISCFPYVEKKTKNLVSLKSFFDFSSNDARDKMKCASSFNLCLAPIFENCFYLNKILVFEKYKGLSYGRLLFDYFLTQASIANLNPALHVHKNNFQAINFYIRQGFIVENSHYEYFVCKAN